MLLCCRAPASLAPFIGAHLLCVMLASLFAFCSVFAILGTFAAILPRDLFRVTQRKRADAAMSESFT